MKLKLTIETIGHYYCFIGTLSFVKAEARRFIKEQPTLIAMDAMDAVVRLCNPLEDGPVGDTYRRSDVSNFACTVTIEVIDANETTSL